MEAGYVYSEIKEDILARILRAEFLPGEKIPSTRESAIYYNVNPNTVSKAYQALSRDGIVVKKRTYGYYVVENEEYIEQVRENIFKSELDKFMKHMKEFGLDTQVQVIRLR